MGKPRLLDLFCGAGGCTKGYQMAGFYVVGVDINPQPRYCGDEFHHADAMTFPLDGFDVIHASPPCKAHTKAGWAIRYGFKKNHADLLTPIRERLKERGGIWVIENVPGAPMNPHIVLCGSQFGLNLRRHRLFELSRPILALLPKCQHLKGVASPFGHARKAGELATWGPALGIDWMNEDEMAQAIPPAYTEWIGKQLMEVLS